MNLPNIPNQWLGIESEPTEEEKLQAEALAAAQGPLGDPSLSVEADVLPEQLSAPVPIEGQPGAPELVPGQPDAYTEPVQGYGLAQRADETERTASSYLQNEAVDATNAVRNAPEGVEAARIAGQQVGAGTTAMVGAELEGAKSEAVAAAADSAARQQLQVEEEQAAARQKAAQERIELNDRHTKEMTARIDNVLREPNPARFFNSASTGQMIGLAAATLVGGWAGAKTGGPNIALDIIGKALDGDMKSQSDLIDREQAMLGERRKVQNMEMDSADMLMDDIAAQRVEKLTAAQAQFNKSIAGINLEAAPLETQQKVQEVAQFFQKAISDTGAASEQAMQQRKAREAQARAAREAQRAARAEAEYNNKLLYAASQGQSIDIKQADGSIKSVPAAELYMSRPGAKYADLSKAQEGMVKEKEALDKEAKEAAKYAAALPGEKGEQISIGTFADDEASKLGRKQFQALAGSARDINELQKLIAEQGTTDMKLILKQASRDEGNARLILQKIARLNNREVQKLPYELGPKQQEKMAEAMGMDMRDFALAVTPDGLNEFAKKTVEEADDFIGSGRMIQTPEQRETWLKERENLLNAGSQDISSMPMTSLYGANEAGKVLGGAQAERKMGKRTPAQDASFAETTKDALRGLAQDPNSEAARGRFAAVRAAGGSVYPPAFFNKLAKEVAQEDGTKENLFLSYTGSDVEKPSTVYNPATKSDMPSMLNTKNKFIDYMRFVDDSTRGRKK